MLCVIRGIATLYGLWVYSCILRGHCGIWRIHEDTLRVFSSTIKLYSEDTLVYPQYPLPLWVQNKSGHTLLSEYTQSIRIFRGGAQSIFRVYKSILKVCRSLLRAYSEQTLSMLWWSVPTDTQNSFRKCLGNSKYTKVHSEYSSNIPEYSLWACLEYTLSIQWYALHAFRVCINRIYDLVLWICSECILTYCEYTLFMGPPFRYHLHQHLQKVVARSFG